MSFRSFSVGGLKKFYIESGYHIAFKKVERPAALAAGRFLFTASSIVRSGNPSRFTCDRLSYRLSDNAVARNRLTARAVRHLLTNHLAPSSHSAELGEVDGVVHDLRYHLRAALPAEVLSIRPHEVLPPVLRVGKGAVRYGVLLNKPEAKL